jgi:hypothetical protein
MFKDPIVEEVHALRAKIAAECDYDLHRMSERANEFLNRHEGQIKTVTKEDVDRIRNRSTTSEGK